MAYDFDQIIDRRSAGSAKWNFYPEDVLPMWVADMDFRAPEAVVRALREKVEHGIFGYEQPSEALIDVVRGRLRRLYDWDVPPQQIIVLPGLVTGLNAVCRALGRPGDGVLMQTPVYPPFLSAPQNHQLVRQVAPLSYVSDGETFHYEIDYDAFESAITPQTKVFLLCNPHNPIGQIYNRDELGRLAEICLRHNVTVCSDEIHAELLLDDLRHTPLATLSPDVADRSITLIAASKTFNVPGLFCSFLIVPNPELRHRIIAAAEGIVPWPNALGLAAAQAAFSDDPDTEDWLAGLRRYLALNRDMLVDFVTHALPCLRTTRPQATFLAWLDCRPAGLDDPYEFFLQRAKVGLNDGLTFGDAGAGFVRLNFGCPRSTLAEGLARMKRALAGL